MRWPPVDPNRFPVPVVGSIPPGGSATVVLHVDFGDVPPIPYHVSVPFSANGGRATGSIELDHHW